jgi:YtkA-like protein
MSPGTRVALLAIVLASAVGATTMCLLVVRYGFPAPEEDDPEGTRRGLAVTRVGHAFAATCFAITAILATLIVTRPAAGPPLVADSPAASPSPSADTVTRVRAEMEELVVRLEDRIAALEERPKTSAAGDQRPRVAAAPSEPGPAPAAPAPSESTPTPREPATAQREAAPESREVTPAPRPPAPARSAAPAAPALPPPTLPPRSIPRQATAEPLAERAPSPRGPLAARSQPPTSPTESLSASPGLAGHLTVTTQGVRVELTSVPPRPGAGETIIYTARLSDVRGLPVMAANVSVEGAMADGGTTRVRLEPAAEAGVYRGRVAITSSGPQNLRLRVSHNDTRFELPLHQ